jgi:hypothetical protein
VVELLGAQALLPEPGAKPGISFKTCQKEVATKEKEVKEDVSENVVKDLPEPTKEIFVPQTDPLLEEERLRGLGFYSTSFHGIAAPLLVQLEPFQSKLVPLEVLPVDPRGARRPGMPACRHGSNCWRNEIGTCINEHPGRPVFTSSDFIGRRCKILTRCLAPQITTGCTKAINSTEAIVSYCSGKAMVEVEVTNVTDEVVHYPRGVQLATCIFLPRDHEPQQANFPDEWIEVALPSPATACPSSSPLPVSVEMELVTTGLIDHTNLDTRLRGFLRTKGVFTSMFLGPQVTLTADGAAIRCVILPSTG